MKISANWLREYIETDLSDDLIAEKLTLLGLEVEEVEKVGSDFEGFVVGEITDVRSHPNADRLQICDVNLGDDSVQIVCGAKNVAKGQKVPVATVGSTLPVPLPDGSSLTIKKAKLRGEKSQGMICSEMELGLSESHEGIMVMDSELKVGSSLKKALKIDTDTVFEIGLTPNRPDAACHIGVARDLSAVLDGELKNPYSDVQKSELDLSNEVVIGIDDTEKCRRYVGLIVKDVTVEESPLWLQHRIRSIGLRPINNVVDATNFILHEIGQPLHAFDLNKIVDKKIIVQSFDKEVTFETLDDVERKVPAHTLFICDGEGPVAIAGVMGGKRSEVTEETTDILIESAYFDPATIRKASKALALQTDSSYRFERGIDPTVQLRAAHRAATMIAELAGGLVVENQTDIHPIKHEAVHVDLRISRVNRLLGTDLDLETVSNILKNLDFSVQTGEGSVLKCTVPPFRPDVTREVDLIEEVGRVFDYNNIPIPESSPFVTPESLSDWEQFNEQVRGLAKSIGYKEISTNSLLSKKEASSLSDENELIATVNPVSQENTTLRPSLLGGFLKAVRYNFNRNEKELRFFELGHTFLKSEKGTWVDGVKEHSHLLMGVSGLKHAESWRGKNETFSIFDLKSDLEALFTELRLNDKINRKTLSNEQLDYYIENTKVAELSIIGEDILKAFDVEQESFSAEIDLTELFSFYSITADNRYTKVPKFPTFEFDAAFIVDKEVRTGELAAAIEKSAGEKLVSISVFDVYEGENLGTDKKSIAFRLSFLDSNKTLTIKDVEPIIKRVVKALESEFDAKLRS